MVKIYWGAERYNVDASARRDLKDSEVRSFDFPKAIELPAVLAAGRSPSFFGKTGLWLKFKSLSVKDMQGILKLVTEFADDDGVVIVITAESVNRKTKEERQLVAKMEDIIKEYPKFGERDREKLEAFVAAVAEKEGVKIDKLAAREIVTRSNYFGDAEVTLYTLQLLTQQVALMGDITTETVVSVIPESPAEKAYLLAGQLANGEHERLTANANKLLESQEFNEIGLLALIEKPFRLAWVEKSLGKGASGADSKKFNAVMALDTAILGQVCDALEEGGKQIKDGVRARVAFSLALAKAELIAAGQI